MKSGLLTFLRLAISAALVGWLLWANRGGFAELRQVEVGRLWPAAGVFALSTLLGGWQWTLILRRGSSGQCSSCSTTSRSVASTGCSHSS